MSLKDHKVADGIETKLGVVAAPDKLTGTPEENKKIFDRLIRDCVKGCLNGLIDALMNPAAAAELGFAPPEGVEAKTVQEAIENLLEKVDGLTDDKAEKAADAVPGNLAVFDAEGNPVDSGKNLYDIKDFYVALCESWDSEKTLTTLEELNEARAAGKTLLCESEETEGSVYYSLCYFLDNTYGFVYVDYFPSTDILLHFAVCHSRGWEFFIVPLASTSHKHTPASIGAASTEELAAVKQQNRVFYGTCTPTNEGSADVYLTEDSKARMTGLQDGDVLFVRMLRTISKPGLRLSLYGTAGWTNYATAITFYNPATGGRDPLEKYHWPPGSEIMFVYNADDGYWITSSNRVANTEYYGITKLNNTLTSTSTREAATANAVKQVNDKAVALQKNVGSIDTALDAILALQQDFMGGNEE